MTKNTLLDGIIEKLLVDVSLDGVLLEDESRPYKDAEWFNHQYGMHVGRAKADIQSYIDKAVRDELNSLKTKKIKGVQAVDMKWIDKRLSELSTKTSEEEG